MAAAVAVIGGGVVGVSFSSVFAAEQVLVLGARHLRPWEVRRIAGVEVGTNVLLVDLHRATLRLERNGWVARAWARRELPATIVIEVRERRAVGLTTVQGRDAVVMADGTVLVGPIVRAVPWIGAAFGPPSAASVADLAAALRALAPWALRKIRHASLDPSGSLRLELRRGVGVVYGSASEFEEKGKVLAELLRWAEDHGRGVTAFDISVPSAPTARLAGGAPFHP